MHADGTGVYWSDAEAVKWYSMAAEQGVAQAQHNLGVMYANGTGVPENNVRAYVWWSLAEVQGNESAASYLDIVEEQMTPAQIAKAQALAAEWLEKHNN